MAANGVEADAQVRFKEGVALLKAHSFEAARVKFLQVYAIMPTDNVLMNLALAEKGAGMKIEAITHLRKYLASSKVSAEDADRVRHTSFAELERDTGHLDIRGPANAAVKVDDSLVGAVPLAGVVDVMPGKHPVVIGSDRVDVLVAAGETKVVEPPKVEQPAAVATAPVAATGPAQPKPPETGPTQPPATPITTEHAVVWPPPTHAIVLSAVTLTALGVGVGFTVDASSKNSDANNAAPGTCATVSSPACQSVQDKIDTRDRDRRMSAVFFIAGGAAAVVTGVTWWIWPRRVSGERPPLSGMVPMVTPQGAGLTWHGEF